MRGAEHVVVGRSTVDRPDTHPDVATVYVHAEVPSVALTPLAGRMGWLSSEIVWNDAARTPADGGRCGPWIRAEAAGWWLIGLRPTPPRVAELGRHQYEVVPPVAELWGCHLVVLALDRPEDVAAAGTGDCATPLFERAPSTTWYRTRPLLRAAAADGRWPRPVPGRTVARELRRTASLDDALRQGLLPADAPWLPASIQPRSAPKTGKCAPQPWSFLDRRTRRWKEGATPAP